MPPARDNLFSALPTAPLAEELVEILAQTPAVRIERIVSTGQASPPGFWYDQDGQEWVALLSGAATLRFADQPEPTPLNPGDWVLIAAHRRHRVETTDRDQPSVWLAVHFDPVTTAIEDHDPPQ